MRPSSDWWKINPKRRRIATIDKLREQTPLFPQLLRLQLDPLLARHEELSHALGNTSETQVTKSARERIVGEINETEEELKYFRRIVLPLLAGFDLSALNTLPTSHVADNNFISIKLSEQNCALVHAGFIESPGRVFKHQSGYSHNMGHGEEHGVFIHVIPPCVSEKIKEAKKIFDLLLIFSTAPGDFLRHEDVIKSSNINHHPMAISWDYDPEFKTRRAAHISNLDWSSRQIALIGILPKDADNPLNCAFGFGRGKDVSNVWVDNSLKFPIASWNPFEELQRASTAAE